MTGRKKPRRLIRFGLPVLVLALLVAACGDDEATTTTVAGSSTTAGGASKLVVASVMPFTGENAAYGPEQMAGCYPFELEVEAAGGILGVTDIECIVVDTADDPTLAVTAAGQLIATEPNLISVLGPTTNVAPAVVPLFDEAQVPMFVTTGDPVFNQTDYQYFWRLLPADDAIGRVLALTADELGYGKGAAIFGSDLASQGAIPTLLDGWAKLGHEMVIEQTLAEGVTSYRSEVMALLAAEPDVIFMEADPQTSATYLTELQQLGSLIPIVGTAVTMQPEWLEAVSGAIGVEAMQQFYVGVMPYAPPEGPAWTAYNTRLLTLGGKLDAPEQYSADGYTFAAYDGLVIAALAAEASGSTDPGVFNAFIMDVTRAREGATVVNTFAEGKAALANGEDIQYVGVLGEFAFDQWHNSPGAYEARRFVSVEEGEQVVLISASDIAALAG